MYILSGLIVVMVLPDMWGIEGVWNVGLILLRFHCGIRIVPIIIVIHMRSQVHAIALPSIN